MQSATGSAALWGRGIVRQIDRLVYELYGLAEEEIAIVEGRNVRVKHLPASVPLCGVHKRKCFTHTNPKHLPAWVSLQGALKRKCLTLTTPPTSVPLCGVHKRKCFTLADYCQSPAGRCFTPTPRRRPSAAPIS